MSKRVNIKNPWNPESAYNNDFALSPVDNMTFPCIEWVIVQFFYLLGFGYVLAGVPPPERCTSLMHN